MKLVIVEQKPDISKKVSRIIKLTDPSIEIVAVVKTIAFLKAWLKTRQAPDMVLINQACLDTTSFSQQHLQAKLLFPHRKTTLTYYAFRMHTILQSWNRTAKLPAQISDISENVVQLSNPRQTHEMAAVPTPFSIKNRFMVRQGQRFFSVPVVDIAYFFSDERFVYLTTFQKTKYVISYRLDELQQMLDVQIFYRVNRTYIVSFHALQQISSYFGGRFKLKLVPPVNEEVLVSKNRARGFREWLGE